MKDGGTGGYATFVGYSVRTRMAAVLLSNAASCNTVHHTTARAVERSTRYAHCDDSQDTGVETPAISAAACIDSEYRDGDVASSRQQNAERGR